MGKKKDKKAAKAARAARETQMGGGTTRSLPDELIEQGAALLAKANTPAGREMIAAGLTMAAAAASAALVKRGAKADAAKADAPGGAAAASDTRPAMPIADALNQAADALAKMLGPKKAG